MAESITDVERLCQFRGSRKPQAQIRRGCTELPPGPVRSRYQTASACPVAGTGAWRSDHPCHGDRIPSFFMQEKIAGIKSPRIQRGQLALDLRSAPRWGGRRTGAGRKRGSSSRVPHTHREPLGGRHPCHVTLRVQRGLPSLRSLGLVRELERSFREMRERRSEFRLATTRSRTITLTRLRLAHTDAVIAPGKTWRRVRRSLLEGREETSRQVVPEGGGSGPWLRAAAPGPPLDGDRRVRQTPAVGRREGVLGRGGCGIYEYVSESLIPRATEAVSLLSHR